MDEDEETGFNASRQISIEIEKKKFELKRTRSSSSKHFS